jgi:glyoxylase-like metal-dependent hydrolase (beta-lactamase superfamily II)
MANWVYLLGDPQTKRAAVVDPAWEVDRILESARKNGFAITDVLVTHGHPDHVNGVEETAARTGARIHAAPGDFVPSAACACAVVPSGENIPILLGTTRIEVIETPGHSPGSRCFLVEGRLLTGDTLFFGGCGRTDLPGGDPCRLAESLLRLSRLDDSLRIFPGHHYGPVRESTLGEEKRRNPFLP